MQYDVVHTGHRRFEKHYCLDTLPSTLRDAELNKGTVVRCAVCGRYWYVKRKMLMNTYYWWGEVHWWSWWQWSKIWSHSSDGDY